jgi:hypothetical protein
MHHVTENIRDHRRDEQYNRRDQYLRDVREHFIQECIHL